MLQPLKGCQIPEKQTARTREHMTLAEKQPVPELKLDTVELRSSVKVLSGNGTFIL
jgi:hypothetical protein